ncbi:MAG: hypothetical protein ACP5RV_09695, partial [Thiomonas sp.]
LGNSWRNDGCDTTNLLGRVIRITDSGYNFSKSLFVTHFSIFDFFQWTILQSRTFMVVPAFARPFRQPRCVPLNSPGVGRVHPPTARRPGGD